MNSCKTNGYGGVLPGFKDILQERRLTSDMLWSSRSWKPIAAYIQPFRHSPGKLKQLVLNSYRLKEAINGLQENNNPQSSHLLYQSAWQILSIMGYGKVLPILRWLSFITSKLLKKLCGKIYVNEAKLLRIKSNMGNNPLTFLPTHRSYADFILMSYICFSYELDIPRIAAAMDFQKMKFVGSVLRKSCAFFIQRSYADDDLYREVLAQYVDTLVTQDDSSLEFFIEGTRSRTGKGLVPKFGLLAMSLKPFLTGSVPEVSIVPVNFSYDRVLEEFLFVYELLGVPKPKESTQGLFKSLSSLGKNYGDVYVTFGDAISIREMLDGVVDRSVHGTGPVQLQDLTQKEAQQIERIGYTVARHQMDLTVLTCFNLIAAIINNHIMSSSEPLQMNELLSEMIWLLPVMRAVCPAVAVSGDVVNSVSSALDLHKNIVTVTGEKRIKLLRTHCQNDPIDESKLMGHKLDCKTMDAAVPLLLIQYYSNPCAHFLVNLAFILLMPGLVDGNGVDNDTMHRNFQFLRSVFSYEFVFFSETATEDFKKAVALAKKFNAITQTGRCFHRGENVRLLRFCNNFIRMYISSCLMTADTLLKCPTAMTEKDVLRSYQREVELCMSRGPRIHPAALSLNLASNAVRSFMSMGAVKREKRDNQILIKVHKEELLKISEELSGFTRDDELNCNLTEHFSNAQSAKL